MRIWLLEPNQVRFLNLVSRVSRCGVRRRSPLRDSETTFWFAKFLGRSEAAELRAAFLRRPPHRESRPAAPAWAKSSNLVRLRRARFGSNGSEALEVVRRVDVGQEDGIELQLDDVELFVGTVERERAVREAPLEDGQRGLRPGAGERARLRDGCIAARGAKGADDLGRDVRTVDGEEHGDLRRGGAEPGDDTGDRRPHA